jgi:hypothetical protein
VHPACWDGIQICGQRGNQSLTFTSFHLCDVAQVQGPTTHQLNIKVPKPEGSLGRFAHCSESFRQQVIEGFTGAITRAQFIRFSAQLVIREVRELILEVISRRGKGRKLS